MAPTAPPPPHPLSSPHLRSLLILGLLTTGSVALKAPFRMGDVLPALHHQVSWPVLNTIHRAVNLLPTFVGTVTPGGAPINWKGSCFFGSEAHLNATHGGAPGSGTIRITTSQAHSWTCVDLYVFATPYRVMWDYYFSARKCTLKIDSWKGSTELDYVKQHGISVFLMPRYFKIIVRCIAFIFKLNMRREGKSCILGETHGSNF